MKLKELKYKNIFILLLIIALIFLFMSNIDNAKRLKVYENFENVKVTDADILTSYQDKDEVPTTYLTEDFYTCISSNLKEEDYGDTLKSKISDLKSYFSSNSATFSYEDLTTGFTMDYGGSKEVYAASTTKTAVAQYVYNKASKGEIDLNQELTYKKGQYMGGTGVIRYDKVGSKYSIKTLVDYMIRYSDNIALTMLQDEFGMSKIKSYWKDLGVTSLYTLGSERFGYISANDSRIYLEQLYKFYKNEELGSELLEFYLNSTNKYISSDTYKIANKYGENAPIRHDTAIVFAKNPYLLTILTWNFSESKYKEFYENASKKIEEFHKVYWQRKIEVCM